MADLLPGSVFAGHRIEGVAGRGGMGIVYRATHLALDHVVALKVISPKLAGDARFRRRFADECRHAVQLRHPNVVQIHHAGEEQGLLFVTMDLIEGTDLRGILNRQGDLEIGEAVRIVAEVASALDAAHSAGLVHRDIKPGNVMIEDADGSKRVYLTDFGLARHVEATSGVTATGAFVGTLDYVAPEQIMGERVDARADVYSLACVLFELITGNPPFGAREDKIEKMYAHMRDEPPRLRVMRPDVPAELDLVVERALSKDPAERFPSAGDFARAAEAALEGEAASASERSVATGAAAPVEDTVALTGQDTEPPISRPGIDATPPPDAGGSRQAPPRVVVAVLAAIAIVVAALVLLGGGDEEPSADDAPPPPPPAGATSPIPVAVGGLPVELTPVTQGIWVTSRSSGSVTLIDTQFSAGQAGAPKQVGNAPEGIAAAAGSLFVALGGDGAVAKLDELDGSLKKTIDGFDKPQGVAFADGSIWVTDSGSDELIEIEPATARAEEPIPVGDEPYGIAGGADAIWVTNRADGTVSRVPLGGGEVTTTAELGDGPKGIAVAGDSVWVALTESGEVVELDAADGTEAGRIDVADEPRGVVFAFGSIWVASAAGAVTRIDPETGEIADEIPLTDGLEGITADDESIWVANGADGVVTRIDPGA